MSAHFDIGGWVPILNKNRMKSGDSHHKLFTLFVDNLPEDVSQNWLTKTYSIFGTIRDVFIPSKRSKVTGKNFGFVKFDNETSAERAIEKTNGIWVEDKKLFVKWASFDKKHVHLQQNAINKDNNVEPSKKGEVNATMPNVWSGINKKTFAQVVNRDAVGKMNEEPFDKGANALGKIKIQPLENEWLRRSAVASLHQPMFIDETEKEFLKLGVDNIQVRAMGGRSILLTMNNQLLRDETIKEDWLHRWFSEVNPWDGETASLDRFTWISCQGIPLDAWSQCTFKSIGDLLGCFISTDESTLKCSSFAKGMVLITTDSYAKLDGWIKMEIGESTHKIKVTEEECFQSDLGKILNRVVNEVEEKKDGKIGENGNIVRYLLSTSKEVVESTKHGVSKTHEEGEETSNIQVNCFPEFSSNNVGDQMDNAEGDAVVDDSLEDDSIEDSDGDEAVNTEVVEETQWEKMVEMANSMEVVEPMEGINLRASQMEGINLMVDLRPASVRRKIRRQFFDECSSVQESDGMDESESLGTQRLLDVEKEFQETLATGNCLGVFHSDSDALRIKEMIVSDFNRFAALQKQLTSC